MVRNRGFTLIELMVVMFTISVLLGVAALWFQKWFPRQQLKAASEDLYSSFQTAKMEAIKANGQCAVTFDQGNHSYSIVNGGSDGNYGTADDKVLKTTFLSSYNNVVSFHSVGYSGNRVIFNANGMTNVTGSVRVKSADGKTYSIGTPTLAGAVTIK